jgi:hypothetical protein
VPPAVTLKLADWLLLIVIDCGCVVMKGADCTMSTATWLVIEPAAFDTMTR